MKDPAHPDIDDISLTSPGELDHGLADELRARVKSELEPGERLIWEHGSSPLLVPNRVGYLTSIAISLVLLVGGALVIFFARRDVQILKERDSPIPIGIVLCVAGIVTMIGTCAHWINTRIERRRQSGISYAVTDRRAITWIPEPKTHDAIRVISIRRGTITSLERVIRPDGSGDLDFALSESSHHQWRFSGFKRIADVRRVEQIVRNNLMPVEKTG